jgi:bacterioferritin-associated ferredoxin
MNGSSVEDRGLTSDDRRRTTNEKKMLICHCNIITEKEIEQTITSLLETDPWQLIVPAKVYHAMMKRGRCCGCFPNVVETIIRVTENYHARSAQGADIVSHLDRVRSLRDQYGSRRHERRSAGHRAA